MSLAKIIGIIVAIPTVIIIVITWYIEGEIISSLLKSLGVNSLIIGIIGLLGLFVLMKIILDLY